MDILSMNDKTLIVKYIDNEFDDKFQRKIKNKKINYDKTCINIKEFLNKLNIAELEKLDRFIKVQMRVKDYHMKNKNYDSFRTIEESIRLMNDFRLFYKSI